MSSQANPKKISTKTVKGVYDLALAYFTANPELVAAETTASQHVTTTLAIKLGEIGYQRAENTAQVLKSHDTKLARDGGERMTAADADDAMAQLYQLVTGIALARSETAGEAADTADAPASASAAVSDDSSVASDAAPAAGDADTTPGTVGAAPAAARATAFDIESGAEALINPTLKAATGGRVDDIATLFAAHDAARGAREESEAVVEAYRAAIAAFQAGEETVDENGLTAPAKFTASGYALLATDGDMVPVLDTMLASKVAPATDFASLVAAIRDNEEAAANAVANIKTLKRDLRRARPKTRTAAAPATAGHADSARPATADSLSEVDAIDAGCEVIEEVAADLFPKCYGANPQLLGFEVPRLDFGEPHPGVPTVDPTFRFYTGVLTEALHSVAENEIVWLYGDSGCGKSEFWQQVAAHLNMPFTRMNMDGNLTRSDIVGINRLLPAAGGGTEMRFVEGILPRAMARPGILLIDEFDLGDPEIMPILQPVLEGNPLTLLEDEGRIVHPHPMFRIAITANTIGLGSENQMYLNAFEQSGATRDRISSYVEMPYMTPEIEKEVVMARLPDADENFVAKLIQLAGKVREGYRQATIHSLFSTRAVLYCARRHVRFAPLYPTPEQAADEILRTVILNRLDAASHNTVKGMIDNIFA